MNENSPPIVGVLDPRVTGIDPIQRQAQSPSPMVPLLDVAPVESPRVVVSNPGTTPWHRAIPWKHVAIVLVIALVIWWVLEGEDPIETVKEVAATTVKAAEGAAAAVTP